MDATIIVLNVSAIVASLLALTMSSLLAIRQHLLIKQQNQIPVFVDLLREARTPEFRHRERRVWNELPTFSSESGFGGLSDEIRDDAEVVFSYYSTLAYCVAIGVVNPDMAVVPVHYRLLKTWDTLHPFVLAEREARDDGDSFLNLLEDLVTQAKASDMRAVEERISRIAFPDLAASKRLSGR
ncbi:hypothetical protein Q5425_32210 [Amycolatopsis sp. A133]|uniref:hypothetical protein n=1 Tax=Amycolatopsis sp. A133 TaxID=3064472 RepID=UPI0027EDA3FA|nr:hypothetical protein [Amycolatopsis sp. A133]MDQ7808422.1 hypothetical protein [Amycolatopsis sp. A133]